MTRLMPVLRGIRRPSPAMTVALVALFIALGGTASAVTVAIVSLAQRALSADNAKRLQGKSAAAVASIAGPASTARSLISVKTENVGILAPGQLSPGTVACDPGTKIVTDGWSQVGGATTSGGDRPLNDTTWESCSRTSARRRRTSRSTPSASGEAEAEVSRQRCPRHSDTAAGSTI